MGNFVHGSNSQQTRHLSLNFSCRHTHERQGRVERKHQHIVETCLSLLAHSSTSARYWHYAIESAIFLINRLPSVSTQSLSPYEPIHRSKPDYSFLKTFSCLCFPYLRPYNKHKFDFRSKHTSTLASILVIMHYKTNLNYQQKNSLVNWSNRLENWVINQMSTYTNPLLKSSVVNITNWI